MGQLCLDTEDCQFQNRDKARFCARCGIPLAGTLMQGRYEIQELVSKDRASVTLHAVDRHEGHAVTVRALLPKQSSEADRICLLQDAEFAMAFSSRMQEPGSIHVTDYGQDGPVAFLVKSEFSPSGSQIDGYPFKPRMTARVEGSIFPINSPPPSVAVENQPEPLPDDDDETATQVRVAIPKGIPAVQQSRITAPGPPALSHNWLAQGNRAYEMADYDQALAAYEAAIAQDATLVEAWSGKGATLLHLGRSQEALSAYDHALKLHPNDPDLWNSRANVLHDLQRYAEEMYCYDQALARDPSYVFAWSGRGMTLAEQGHTEEALLAFDQALMLDPGQSVIWQAMTNTLYSIQRYDDALLAINRALELDANNAALWDTKGNILRRMKKPDEIGRAHRLN